MRKKIPGTIQFFSDETNSFYQLLPTSTVPVLKINSVPMQRYVRIDPLTDTKTKVNALRPFGNVLEICTGLGYTAIQSAKLSQVKEITTIEKDPEVLKMAKMNQASSQLFTNPKIKMMQADASELIKDFKADSFDCILHDPPTFTMAPELYSRPFYAELFRVLKKGRRIWHYAPMPGKAKNPKKGENFVSNIIKRMKEVGFADVVYDENSCGVTARKP